MNRKQLEIQNASFLAELERKAKEIEILNIRLEDAEQKAEALANEKMLVENLAEELKAENNELCEKVASLEAALEEAKTEQNQNEVLAPAEETETVGVKPAPEVVEPVAEEAEELEQVLETEEVAEEVTEKAEEVSAPLTEIDMEIEKQIEQVAALAGGAEFADVETEAELEIEPEAETEEVTPEAAEEPKAEENAPAIIFDTPKDEGESTDAFLRNYGAKIIAKVTLATAEVMARATGSNDEVSKSIKTLALGKNESFKYQIMELSRQKQDPQKAAEEMDLLAEETIVYLKSI